MEPTDDELLMFREASEFDYTVDDAGPDEARQLLAEHPELFRQHLIVASLLEQQANSIEGPGADRVYGKIENRGYKRALRDIAGHLRAGEFLPDRRGNRYWEHFGD